MESRIAHDGTPHDLGHRLSEVSVSARSMTSSIGSRIRFTWSDGTVSRRSISTFGGFIRVGGKIYGLTTAHDAVEPPEHSNANTSSDAGSGPSTTYQSGADNTVGASSWLKATLGPFKYGADSQGNGSDFALIELDGHHTSQANHYTNPETGASTSVTSTAEVTEGTVVILCSPTDGRKGVVIDQDASFFDGEAIFSTVKIQTDSILDRSTSGTWVARGSHLLGIIIATYDDEPCAHMMPISKVVADIKAALANGNTVPEFGFPGHGNMD